MAGRTSTRTSHRKYGKAAATKVKAAVHEEKRGKLRSGRSGRKVTSRKQAAALAKALVKGDPGWRAVMSRTYRDMLSSWKPHRG